MDKLPKYYETFIPVLKILENGEVISYNEMRKRVRDTYYADLPAEALALTTQAGDQLILNRIGWAKAYLKQAGMLIQPDRGLVQITDKGKKISHEGVLTLEQLTNDPVFLANRRDRKSSEDSQSVVASSLTPQEMVEAGIREIDEQVKASLLERLKSVDPYYFESVILKLFKKMGYGDVQVTAKSGDGGIDGIISQDKLGLEKIFTQAKRYNDHDVRELDIRNFIGAMSGGTTKGIFVTTSGFDEKAVRKAKDAHNYTIRLIDGYELVDLMYNYEIGVQEKSAYSVKEVDEDFFEPE